VFIATGDPLVAQLRLILQLAALAEAVIDLRTALRHAAQSAAARAAAERLRAARRGRCGWRGDAPAVGPGHGGLSGERAAVERLGWAGVATQGAGP